ncbi:MAG TPA: malto-oligosyltrehalose synthase [Chitinispirillaceae bacterium]|nr:malto-oligosyltrehalose synthase [Chitinispirillaceae bacterium]
MQIPDATYRLQFNAEFTFEDAENRLEYLKHLGISHIYASPILKSRNGSMHGYDIVDYNVISERTGGMSGFERLTDKVKQLDMGWIQDIVPNHMAFDKENSLLNELLENGPENSITHHFDIDWNHQYDSLQGKLLIPILGNIYAACLEQGEIKLTYQNKGFALAYYDYLFPLKIESYVSILGHKMEQLLELTDRESAGIIKFLGVLYLIKNLPSERNTDGRSDEISFAKEMLWELYSNNMIIHSYIDNILIEFNGVYGDPGSFTLLDAIHDTQYFKLSYWKVANEELNYRRFFIINDLISVRVEDPAVFDTVHKLIFQLYKDGRINGLRIDHIDGLYDPYAYLQRLRCCVNDGYIVVEKILGTNELLPDDWLIEGTTGYDFCNIVNQLFCCSRNELKFTQLYQKFSGNYNSFEKTVKDAKRLILKKNMAGDIDNLASLIKTISTHDRWGSDITLYGLRSALVELMIRFPVYRSYINTGRFSEEDHTNLQKAINSARSDEPGLGREFDFIERFLMLRYDVGLSDDQKLKWTEVVMRFQQFTGPLSAKGVEDTAFYDYNRLVSLNEVGGNPASFGIGTDQFHNFCKYRNKKFPFSMNATSTHDSKRGEDARMRINYLSEIPEEWEKNINAWREINKKFKTKKYGVEIPDSNDEYFFYQTLTGTCPIDDVNSDSYRKRLREYMLKAVREAEIHTAWIEYDKDYERGILSFVDSVTDKTISREFFDTFTPFVRNAVKFGCYYSLSQCLLKMTAPGIPDFYQGSELWDLAMVDPDNRHSVDFEKRQAMINNVGFETGNDYRWFQSMLGDYSSGTAKMFLINRVLGLRKRNRDIFLDGAYIDLNSSGEFSNSIVPFMRIIENRAVIVIAVRQLKSVSSFDQFPLPEQVWGDTCIEIPEMPATNWREIITGKTIAVQKRVYMSDVLDMFPGAVLVSDGVNWK